METATDRGDGREAAALQGGRVLLLQGLDLPRQRFNLRQEQWMGEDRLAMNDQGLGLRVRAAPDLAKSTTFAQRFIVNQDDRSCIERCRRCSCWRNGNVYVTMWAVSYQIEELLLADGDSPFGQWFGSLEAVAAAKVRVAVSRMEQGNLSNVEWFRGIGEYKIDWGPGLRIYLAKDGMKIIVLIGGGTKKRQQQDIDNAMALWEDYKRRKASTPKGAK
jgi:putative addiction module killer protein